VLAAAGCLLVLGGWAASAVADQSVIDLMNKTAAQKAVAQGAAEAPAPKSAVRPKAGAKAPAAKTPAKPTPTPVPRPEQALMEPQSAPDCAFRGPVSSPITADELRMKLDYEAQCYRQAEAIVRARLQQLQDTIKASAQRNSLLSNR